MTQVTPAEILQDPYKNVTNRTKARKKNMRRRKLSANLLPFYKKEQADCEKLANTNPENV